MKNRYNDKPFPLKKFYLIYAGIGGIFFYVILFAFFIHAERQALYDQYLLSLSEKANGLYQDIDRDILKTHGIQFGDINTENTEYRKMLRKEIDDIIRTDFTLAKVKVFSQTGIVLYDHSEPKNEGRLNSSIHEIGFQTALRGNTSSKLEHENGSKRFMEVYTPIRNYNDKAVVGILEIYEDVTRFEKQVYAALKKALIVPTIIFIIFNAVLFLIVVKADRIIFKNTALLINIRRNMEKYISSSAIDAIYNSVTSNKELFQGEKQTIVIFFSDIRGFTSYSEKNEPEVVVSELNSLFELQAEIIQEHYGIIDKFVGDEIMAIFPEEKTSEAVIAALQIIKAIDSDPKIIFKVGIGIHAGEAVVGSIGTETRRDYTAIGNTINTGARLCGVSEPGEVLISSHIMDKVTDDLREQFFPKENLQLKGKTETIEAYSSLLSVKQL